MKTRYKILTSLLAPITVLPAIFTSASCNKDRYANLAQMMFDNTMQEFYEICKIYRPTFGTEDIARHINDKVYEMDLACDDDWDVVKQHKDEWTAGDHTSGNLLVKLEATPGFEDAPTIILQAHMDMVCDGFSGGIIVPVIEDDILHTKDWKTSLGADNGIGLATLLSIIKYRNNFNHGPIRCIFTADEEDGEGCAHWIQNHWIKGANYIINLDHENIDDVAVSCAGVQQCQVKAELEKAETTSGSTYQDYAHCYQLKVWGVNGGSSGFALEDNPIFAIKLAFEMIDKMFQSKAAQSEHADYIIADIVTDETQTNGSGSISQNITIKLLSKLDYSKPREKEIIKAMMVEAKNLVIQNRAQHPNEIGLKTEFSQIGTTEAPTTGITPTDSKNVTELFAKDDKIKLFGEIKIPGETKLTTCSNAGPVKIVSSNESDKIILSFETFGRTSLEDILGPEPKEGEQRQGFMKYYSEGIQNVLGKQDKSDWITNKGWNPCWQEVKSKFTDLYKEYAARNGKPINDFRAMGWAETAEFVHKAEQLGQTIQPTSIGPTIVDGHTKNGYCVVSSIKEMIQRLLYGIENLTK